MTKNNKKFCYKYVLKSTAKNETNNLIYNGLCSEMTSE